MTHPTTQTLDGSFRVVSSRVLPSKPRRSPNRERAVARIFFWNFALVAVAVALPQLVG